MKSKLINTLAVIATLATATGAYAAQNPINANKVTKTGTVNYSCLNNKNVSVKYGFNAAGVPVSATFKANGATRVLKYDLAHSTDVDINFKDRAGYNLSGDAFDSSNYRQMQGINVMDGNSVFVYKNCSVR